MGSIHALSAALILALTSIVRADIEFQAPRAGATFKASEIITANWKDSGNPPKISELVQYDLYLCAGGDEPASQEELALLKKDGVFAQGNSVSFTIDSDIGGNDESAYFLKMVSSGPSAFAINYSNRFTLTDPEPGSEGDSVHAQKRKVVVDPYTVPYAQQTGPTRYAPMTKKPGTAIPTTSPKPQFPASPYKIATTYLEPGTVETTLTASGTLSVTMMENTAAPATHP